MTVRVGIVGCGIAGRARARAVHEHPGAELVGVHRGRFADQLGAPVVDDPEDLLPVVDVLVVASPSDTHASWVDRALRADLHVVVEYPVARTADEARGLFKLAADRGRVLHVEHIELLAATTRWMAERIAEDGFVDGSMTFTSGGPPHPDASTHGWHQVSRFHRWRAVLGDLQTGEVRRADGAELDLDLADSQGRIARLRTHRSVEGKRALHWRVTTRSGVCEVRGRQALMDGAPVTLPPTTLFFDDLDVALSRVAGTSGSYVPDEAILAVLEQATTLQSRG